MKSRGKSAVDRHSANPSGSLNPKFPSSLVHVGLAARSHPGLVRRRNQDHYLAVRIGRSLETLMTNLADGSLARSFDETAYGLLVADGMGGMAAGEVASSIALLTLVELVVNTPDWVMRMDHSEDAGIIMRRLVEWFRRVDVVLRDRGRADPKLFGMGTTLTVAVSLGHQLFIGHIGDSRAYLLTGGQLHQLTRDHTMAQTLIDAGVLHPEDETAWAMRHVLTGALGSTGEPAEPQVQRLIVNDGDQILLCSDGLTELVEDSIIASTLRDSATADQGCRSLIDLALAHGGIDNVTVVLAHYHFPKSFDGMS